MFYSARLKLTFWYLTIIMLISITFSLVIFAGIHSELRRFERFQRLRIELQDDGIIFPPNNRRIANLHPELLEETRQRLATILVFVNFGILVMAGAAAYFLAGRTLRPIQVMVDEQNRFIADASHEFRTPLTALKTSIEVTLRNKNLGIRDAKETLESSLGEVNDLQILSDHLLLLTQFQKANGYLHFENISLTEVMESVKKKVVHQSKEKNIRLKFNVKDLSVWGDKPSLVELFVIFLDNAIKYSFNKGAVEVSAIKDNDQVEVKVTDAGMGIDKKDLPYIFDRFYRANASRSKNTEPGFGLGLSIARRIVELHKGKIEVKSVPNEKTTFTIRIPSGNFQEAKE